MDLGIQGKKALLAASTSGLGLACATALAREGCLVYINGRDAERLEKHSSIFTKQLGQRPSSSKPTSTPLLGEASLID